MTPAQGEGLGGAYLGLYAVAPVAEINRDVGITRRGLHLPTTCISLQFAAVP